MTRKVKEKHTMWAKQKYALNKMSKIKIKCVFYKKKQINLTNEMEKKTTKHVNLE